VAATMGAEQMLVSMIPKSEFTKTYAKKEMGQLTNGEDDGRCEEGRNNYVK